MNIKILGTGCTNCITLEKRTREAVQELGIDAEIEKITDMREIIQYNILSTPGLVLDGRVVSTGKVPDKAGIAALIINARDIEDKR